MEDAKKMNLTKSIGVSNFNSEQVGRIIENSNVKPAVNQIEVSLFLSHKTQIRDVLTALIMTTAFAISF